ncbi:MAG: hypothetical protein SGPRY_007996, partial [Prymnesium sp.]
AALDPSSVGPATLWLEAALLCTLSPLHPHARQARLELLVQGPARLRVEGGEGVELHLIAHCSGEGLLASREEPKPSLACTPNRSCGQEVLVATYEPKRGGPSLGISPVRRLVKLDDMEAAQQARALEEEDDDDEDEDEDEEGEEERMAMLMRHLGGGGKVGKEAALQRLAELVASELGAAHESNAKKRKEALHAFASAVDKALGSNPSMRHTLMTLQASTITPPSLCLRAARFLNNESSKAAARIILSIDTTYFEIVYQSLTAVPFPSPLPLTCDPCSRVSPFRSSLPEEVSLVRSPAVFFASSHAEGWEEQQLRRLSKLHPPPSSREGGGWVGQVVAHHCELLAQGTEGETNALLLLWRERMLEAIDLLHGGGVADPASYDTILKPTELSRRDKEPPAPPLVRRWREMDRQWPCWMYAFAVPSKKVNSAPWPCVALEVLASHSPLVEMGSGTGFWAAALRERGVKVTAYDSHPPGKEVNNKFHGDCPAFTNVERGAPAVLSKKQFKQVSCEEQTSRAHHYSHAVSLLPSGS